MLPHPFESWEHTCCPVVPGEPTDYLYLDKWVLPLVEEVTATKEPDLVKDEEPDLGEYVESGELFLLLKYLADPEVIEIILQQDSMASQIFHECVRECLMKLQEKTDQIKSENDILSDLALTHFFAILKRAQFIHSGMRKGKILSKAKWHLRWVVQLLNETKTPLVNELSQDILAHFLILPEQINFRS